MPPGVGADLAVGRVGDAEALEQLARARSGVGLGEPLQAPEQHQVLAAGQALVQRGLLAGERRPARARRRARGHVVAGDERAALRRCEQRGEDADGGRLARAVVAEQAEHGAGLDGEVELAQGVRLAERRPRPSVRTAGPAEVRTVYVIVRRTIEVHCTKCQGTTGRGANMGAWRTARARTGMASGRSRAASRARPSGPAKRRAAAGASPCSRATRSPTSRSRSPTRRASTRSPSAASRVRSAPARCRSTTTSTRATSCSS